MKFAISKICSAAIIVAVVASACTSVGSHTGGEGPTSAVSSPDSDVQFPDPATTWLKGGEFVQVEQLRRIGRGMSKDQVRALIGSPHFHEGPFGSKEWNYLFNFRTGKGDEFTTCQYQVIFFNALTDRLVWRDPSCADYLQPRVTEVARPTSSAPERLQLGADALFASDKYEQKDMLPEGRRELDELVEKLKGTYSRLDSITVIGHSDRLGSSAYNQRLSVARAATVRDYLMARGLPEASLRAYGVGETQPVAQCGHTMPRTALVACLKPDRRVELEIRGQR